jgi:hypothetical protein
MCYDDRMMVRRKRAPGRPRPRKGKPRGLTGRPPTGVRPGERLTDYKQVTVRLPPETVAQLEHLSEKLGRPQWRVMCDAIDVLSRASDGA